LSSVSGREAVGCSSGSTADAYGPGRCQTTTHLITIFRRVHAAQSSLRSQPDGPHILVRTRLSHSLVHDRRLRLQPESLWAVVSSAFHELATIQTKRQPTSSLASLRALSGAQRGAESPGSPRGCGLFVGSLGALVRACMPERRPTSPAPTIPTTSSELTAEVRG
jgi:hypothetical protein